VLLVDARSPERFAGVNETVDRAAGHIPGAVNHPFKSNVGPDGTFLPPETLQTQFAATLGARQPSEVICYCGSGVTACHNVLAMTHVGLDGASLFVGSWSEWSSDPARPQETGAPGAR
jgi:thiosulfate/3-mercaptopyruvate sulfurtransferase